MLFADYNYSMKIIYNFFFFIVFILFNTSLYSNESTIIDSLKKELLKKDIHDTTKINIYFKLVENIYDDNIWPEYNEMAYKLSQKILNSKQPEIQRFAQKSQADYFNNKGYLYKLNGKINKAVSYYLQSIKISSSISYKYGEASSAINLSTLLAQQKQLNVALTYLKRAEKLSLELNDKQLYAHTLQSMAGIYTYKLQYDSALASLNKCIKLFSEINYPNGIGEIYNGMGVLYKNINNDSLALHYHFKAKEIFLKTKNLKQLSNTYYNIAALNYSIHPQAGKSVIQESLKYLDSSLYYAQIINFNESIADVYKLRSELYHVYSELKNLSLPIKYNYLKKSLNDFKNYKRYADSILNKEIIENTARQQIQFEFDKKEAILKEQQKREREVATVKQKQNKIIIWSILTLLILMIVFSIFIANRYKITRKQKSIIESQKQIVEEQKRLVEVKNKEIIDSIHYAKRIQQAILPDDDEWKRLLPDSFVLYIPKDIVAGDFYWLVETEHYIFVASADCTGHGVPGAMVSVTCHNALNKAVLEEGLQNTNEILNQTREIVIKQLQSQQQGQLQDGMDICLVRINKKNRLQIQYSGANRPLVVIKDSLVTEYAPDKQPIGYYEQVQSFTAQDIQLTENTCMYLFTDGYADQFGGERNKKLGSKKLKELLSEISAKDTQEQRTFLKQYFEEWKGTGEQMDDVTIIGVRV
jgi:serine phosphatase RsbU (regulator of sigma subunit)